VSATLDLSRVLIERPSVTPDDQGCQQLLAERLQAMVRSRTYALGRSNTDLAVLLEQLNAFHAISYEINQRTRPEQIACTFVDRICASLAGVDGAWVWLAPGLTAEEDAALPPGQVHALIDQ